MNTAKWLDGQSRQIVVAAVLAAVAVVPRSTQAFDAPGATIQVTTTQDELVLDGDCSLREAVQAANTDSPVDACPAGSGPDTILLADGLYKLAIPGAGENENQSGDLDLSTDLRIVGSSPAATIVGGAGLDRVFHIYGLVTVELVRMTIQGGNANDGGVYGGGGVLNQGGTLTLDACILKNNRAERTGGGLDNSGNGLLVDTMLQGNQASAGGGIFNDVTIILRSAILLNNHATSTGGGLDNGNTASLTNVTLTGNTAPSGEAIFNDGTLALYNSTLVDNPIKNMGSNGARFLNTLLYNSQGSENCLGDGIYTSEGHNLENWDTCNFKAANDLTNVEPLLDDLQDNGGPTPTFALQLGSPAIDAGDRIDCPDFDQRGAMRPEDGDGDGDPRCDIGAFELGGIFPEPLLMPLLIR